MSLCTFRKLGAKNYHVDPFGTFSAVLRVTDVPSSRDSGVPRSPRAAACTALVVFRQHI